MEARDSSATASSRRGGSSDLPHRLRRRAFPCAQGCPSSPCVESIQYRERHAQGGKPFVPLSYPHLVLTSLARRRTARRSRRARRISIPNSKPPNLLAHFAPLSRSLAFSASLLSSAQFVKPELTPSPSSDKNYFVGECRDLLFGVSLTDYHATHPDLLVPLIVQHW